LRASVRRHRRAQQQPQFSSPARPSRGAHRTRTSGAASAPRHRKESPHDVRRGHHSEAEARVGPGACGRGVMKASARHPSHSNGELHEHNNDS
jgi:hypothetical protein